MVRVKSRYLVVNYLYPELSAQFNTKEPLPESLQFHSPTPDEFDSAQLIGAIRKGVTDLFGEYGAGMISANLKVKYHSTATSTSIIRCPKAHYQMVWAALTYMTKLPVTRVPVVVKVVRVSGTIRTAEEEIIKRAKEIILKARMVENGAGNDNVGIVGDIMRAVKKREVEKVSVEDDSGSESGSESD